MVIYIIIQIITLHINFKRKKQHVINLFLDTTDLDFGDDVIGPEVGDVSGDQKEAGGEEGEGAGQPEGFFERAAGAEYFGVAVG